MELIVLVVIDLNLQDAAMPPICPLVDLELVPIVAVMP